MGLCPIGPRPGLNSPFSLRLSSGLSIIKVDVGEVDRVSHGVGCSSGRPGFLGRGAPE